MNTLTGNVSRNSRRFLVVAGIILTVTGLAKAFTLTGDTTLLEVPDPIFGIEFRYLMLLVGVGELGVAGFCIFSNRQTLNVIMVASISSGFLAYRVLIRTIDWERPCGCLGNLTDVIGLSPQAAEWIAVGLLGFLLSGSYATLLTSNIICNVEGKFQQVK